MKKNLLTHTLFFTMNKADNNITITFLVPIFYLKYKFPAARKRSHRWHFFSQSEVVILFGL